MKQVFNGIDRICIAQPTNKAALDDAIRMIDSDREPILKIKVDATHSGVLTNMRVYPGKKVASGYTSFFAKDKGGSAEVDKPVLRHHDSHSDAIGRIVNAMFTPLKVGQDFEMDYLNPDKMGGRGSGVVTVDAVIVDPDAIKKIVDGRYLSVSAGHHSDGYLCSVCGDSILKCDHIPGRVYNDDGEMTSREDGSLCYVITNNMTYDELSFVNMPAQPPAKLINFKWEDCKDYQNKENILVDSISTGSKDMVRALVLVDKEDEINLLTGRKASEGKKTMVAVNDATKNKLMAALAVPETSDDDSNVRPAEDGIDDERPEPETKEVDQDMDVKELEQKIKGLEDKLRDADTKISELDAQVKAKDTEIERLNKESKELDSQMRTTLATSLTSLKIRLKKPDVVGLDSKEKQGEFVAKIATRSLQSLQDSVADLMVELEHAKETPEKATSSTKTAAEIVADADKVTNPAGNEKGKKTDQKKQLGGLDALSALDKAIGLQ